MKLSNGLVAVIPKLVRTQVAERIWTSYRDTLAPGDVTKLGRTAFLTVIHFITSTDEKLIRAVDYVSGFLVNETIDGLQGIIDYFLLEGSSNQEETLCQYDDLSRHLTLVRNVLKVQFSNHLSRDGNGHDMHGIAHGLTASPKPPKRAHWSTFNGDVKALWKEAAARSIPYN